jgi:hypothetical protein
MTPVLQRDLAAAGLLRLEVERNLASGADGAARVMRLRSGRLDDSPIKVVDRPAVTGGRVLRQGEANASPTRKSTVRSLSASVSDCMAWTFTWAFPASAATAPLTCNNRIAPNSAATRASSERFHPLKAPSSSPPQIVTP